MKIANQQKQRLRNDRIKLTPHVFGYRKMVMGELLYFGYDESMAQSRAMRVMSLVTDLKRKGERKWPAAALALAKAIAKGHDQPAVTKPVAESSSPSVPNHQPVSIVELNPAAQPAAAPIPAAPVVTFHAAVDAYVEAMKSEANKRKDHGHAGRATAQKRALPDMPLSDVGERELMQLVSFWRSKPTGRRCVYVAETKGWKSIDTGKPIGAQTIKLMVGTARQMFRWFASAASGFDWHAPNLQPIFELKNADLERMRTPTEKMMSVRTRNDESAEHFTVEELEKLWCAASTWRRRLFFLLSLNAGCLTSELSALLVGNCFLDGEHSTKPFIAFMRPKTGVYGKWFLWPDSAADLRKYLRPEYPYGFVDEAVENNKKKYVVKGLVYEPLNNSPPALFDTGLTLDAWRKRRSRERAEWIAENTRSDPEQHVFGTEDGRLLLSASPNGHRNDAVKLVWERWSKAAGVARLSWKNMRKTGSQLVRRAATDLGLNGDYMSELYLAHQAPVMSRPYNRRDDSEYEQLGRVLAEVRRRLGPVFGDADDAE